MREPKISTQLDRRGRNGHGMKGHWEGLSRAIVANGLEAVDKITECRKGFH